MLALLGAAAYIYSGAYDIGADAPHTALTVEALETLRERSIRAHAKDISVPPLDDPQLLAIGAEHYQEMCTGCHLAPGIEDSEIRAGLYPKPPALAEHMHHGHDHGDATASAQRQFWIIKHGIKASGMPAWGSTHDDRTIWGMVAFLQQLPEMDPARYAELTASSGGHGHQHGGH